MKEITMAKEYKIKVTTYRHHASSESTERIYTGTIDHLIKDVFGYTLECGHSWNSKIPLAPKTGKSLVKALTDSAYECRDYRTSYDLLEA